MTIEDICKAAKDYDDGLIYSSVKEQFDVIKAFKAGAEYRINSVWHDTTEKPMRGKLLLVKTLYGGYDLCYYGEYIWNTVMTWAYVKDLTHNEEE